MKYKYFFIHRLFEGIEKINKNNWKLEFIMLGYSHSISRGFWRWFFGEEGYLFIYSLNHRGKR